MCCCNPGVLFVEQIDRRSLTYTFTYIHLSVSQPRACVSILYFTATWDISSKEANQDSLCASLFTVSLKFKIKAEISTISMSSWHSPMLKFSWDVCSNMVPKLIVHQGENIVYIQTLPVRQADRWKVYMQSCISLFMCGYENVVSELWRCVILLHVPLVVRWSSMVG